jgi:uncharacterized membrane protein YhfC
MLINTLTAVSMATLVLGPIVLVIWAGQKLGWRPRWIGAGALCFIGSQLVHLPLNWGLSQAGLLSSASPIDASTALVLGLSAGVCEELTRLAVLSYWVTEVRDHNKATAFGLGHGGIEAVFIGVLGFFSVVNMIALQTMDLDALGLNPEQLEGVRAQVAAFSNQPLWTPLMSVLERAMAMMNHLFMTLLILRAITHKQWGWIVVAISWHTAINAVAVWLHQHQGVAASETALAVFTIIAAGMWWTWRKDP